MSRIFAAALVAANAAACTSANQGVANAKLGETKALVTTGNIRLVTERSRGPDFPPVLCTEPSPDYAVAFSQKTSGKIEVTSAAAGSNTGKAEGEVDYKELVTEGEGRAAAVLALRDGLYAACQSYANGIIGQDSYAMILSQYGALLVALVGGGKADAADGKTPGPVTINGRQGTLSTLVVACISGYDPTRLNGASGPNPLLTRDRCARVLDIAMTRARNS